MNFKLFKNKNFTFFLLGQGTSTLGTMGLHFATAYYVLKITGSASKFASIVALGMIPNLILAPIAGLVADRVNRKKLIIFGDLVRGILDIVLFIYAIFGEINIVILYMLVIFLSVCEVFFAPAFSTILPSIIPKEDLTEAIAIKRTIGRLITVSTPIIAAMLFEAWGFRIMLLLDGVTYLISSLIECFLEIPKLNNLKEKGKLKNDFIDGIKVLFIDKKITCLLINNILTNGFLITFIFIGFPFMILELLGGSRIDYGTVQSIAFIGSLMSVIVIGVMKKRCSIEKCINIALILIVFSCGILLLLLNSTFFKSIQNRSEAITLFFGVSIFIFYLFNAFWGVFYSSLYQTSIPSDKLGRYAAAEGGLITIARLIGLKMYGYLFDVEGLIIPMGVLVVGIILKLIVQLLFNKEVKFNLNK
ncbi:MFS transporter [Oceanirhabdus sp. W0125-5]|uniref:MFS transporter n=1 Tax=Oceanirhabdus sp. W0125-5 TaxID=2999116 RepID=UPI0022F2B9D4|nr:MFS transporter [Oceanirhabdus sp. W0125-5]WBW94855.1 MFS transporter [Oceanirhabdus sp. W0125-5]